MASTSGAFIEVAMSRVILAVVLLAFLGATTDAFAQAGCQPTIMQPCAKASDKTNGAAANQTSRIRTPGQTDDAGEPKDHSPRIRLDHDTDVKFGTGGLGLQRKF
jgi:hypothetical protein